MPIARENSRHAGVNTIRRRWLHAERQSARPEGSSGGKGERADTADARKSKSFQNSEKTVSPASRCVRRQNHGESWNETTGPEGTPRHQEQPDYTFPEKRSTSRAGNSREGEIRKKESRTYVKHNSGGMYRGYIFAAFSFVSATKMHAWRCVFGIAELCYNTLA